MDNKDHNFCIKILFDPKIYPLKKAYNFEAI